MRRFLIAAIAAISVLAVGGVAYAANVYDLPNASTSPKGTGTAAKPVPVGVDFDYTVKDQAGPRGAPVKTYKIAFQGLTTKYAKKFPTCKYGSTIAGTLAEVEAACKKAKVGTGRIESLLTLDTNASNPNSVLAYCNLQLSLYNLGYGLAIRLDADNTAPPTSQDGPIGCLVPTHRSIEAKFKSVKIAGVPSSSLNFDVFDDLRHNAGFTITVGRTTSTIKKLVKKVKIGKKKRKVGLYSSIACGKGKKRTIQVTFVDENGVSSTKGKKTGC
jgi:hypothetical protein